MAQQSHSISTSAVVGPQHLPDMTIRQARFFVGKAEHASRASLAWAQIALTRLCADKPLDEGARLVIVDVAHALELEAARLKVYAARVRRLLANHMEG
jgi:hypothetical protein